MMNGFRAVCILERIHPQREAALQYAREKLIKSQGEDWVSQNVKGDRLWTYICKLPLEAEL
jgi:hypothetical protein